MHKTGDGDGDGDGDEPAVQYFSARFENFIGNESDRSGAVHLSDGFSSRSGFSVPTRQPFA